ncbi:MAG: hypothetical protein IJ809_06335 [Clostridia bacterium]|nr:hypothetical protein [Clostridia bacterium]
MKKDTVLIKAKRLFIDSENYPDDFLYTRYKIIRSILPITDKSCAEVMLDHLDEVMFEVLSKRQVTCLNTYFSPEASISLTPEFYKEICSSLNLIKSKQDLYYIPAIKSNKMAEYNDVNLNDLGISVCSTNMLIS